MTNEERAKKRTQICAIYEADGDWRAKAAQLNEPVSTGYRWVNKGDKTDTQGGHMYTKVTETHKDFMVELIENNPRITRK